MKNQSLIHVKLEQDEALQSKKDILSSEVNLLETIKIMKRYNLLRKEELQSKMKFSRKIKEIAATINKLEKSFPNVIKKVQKKPKEMIKKKTQNKDLEKELEQIREKLRTISR